MYDTDKPNTAKNIASENLTKPNVQQEIALVLKETGVTLKKAATAVSDGLNDKVITTRLRAADMTLKLLDAYPRRRVTDHRHAHVHLAMLRDLEELPEGELEAIIEAESS